MKLIFIITLLFVFSCTQEPLEIYNVPVVKDTVQIDNAKVVDSIDSLIIKTKSLIDSTKNTHKKIKKIKKIVAENKELKQEMIYVKKERDDLIEEVNKQREKKNVFKRVIEAIKDTTSN